MPTSHRSPRHSKFRPFHEALRLIVDVSTIGETATYLADEDPANDNHTLSVSSGEGDGADFGSADLRGSDTHFEHRPYEGELMRAAGATGKAWEAADLDAWKAAEIEAIRKAKAAGRGYFEVLGLRFSLEGNPPLTDRKAGGLVRTRANEQVKIRRPGGSWWRPLDETSDANVDAPQSALTSATMPNARPPSFVRRVRRKRAKLPPIDWSELPDVRGHVPFDLARENAGLPPVDRDTVPCLPFEPERAAKLFMGGRVAARGNRGAAMWVSVLDRMIEAQERRRVWDDLSLEHRSTASALQSASTYADLSRLADNVSGKTRERQGQANLLDLVTQTEKTLGAMS